MVVDRPSSAADAAASASGRAAEQQVVVRFSSHLSGEREWNLWELERIVRERVGVHAVLGEECSFRLMCLRQFARADGTLPAEFDALVREWFADLLDAYPRNPERSRARGSLPVAGKWRIEPRRLAGVSSTKD